MQRGALAALATLLLVVGASGRVAPTASQSSWLGRTAGGTVNAVTAHGNNGVDFRVGAAVGAGVGVSTAVGVGAWQLLEHKRRSREAAALNLTLEEKVCTRHTRAGPPPPPPPPIRLHQHDSSCHSKATKHFP